MPALRVDLAGTVAEAASPAGFVPCLSETSRQYPSDPEKDLGDGMLKSRN